MKYALNELAIFGGQPEFAYPLHVGRPNIGSRDSLLERINALLDSRWLTNGGPFVQEFEERVAEIVGVRHCVSVCNATIALELAISALGMRGEVIVPSFTFVATAHALQWQGVTPVFCDIDAHTHNLDPRRLEERITPRTTGIIGVHLWGRPCAVDALIDIADRHNLELVFDASHAFGCSYRGKMIGGYGHAEVFSFHATKFLNSFEGGAVVTNDSQLAARLRLLKNFGFVDYDRVEHLGTNGKMSEIAAAMGLTSLESMHSIISVNRRNYLAYQTNLGDIPGVRLLKYDETENENYQYIVLEVDAASPLDREGLLTVLHAENVLARRYFYPGCHNMEPYRSLYPEQRAWLPETERVAGRVLVLPTGTAVDEIDVEAICRIVRFAVDNGSRIADRLTATTPAGAVH